MTRPGSSEGGLRIAHFVIGRCNPDSANGLDKAVWQLSRAQAELGHPVSVFSLTPKEVLPIPGVDVSNYAPVRWLASVRGRPSSLRDGLLPAALPRSLIQDLTAWRPDILHLHFVHVPQNILLARAATRRRIPYCVTIHGGLSGPARRRHALRKAVFNALFERRYLDEAAFVLAISAEDEDGARRYGVTNTVVVVPNGFDAESLPTRPDRSVLASEFPALAGKRVFLFLGRLDYQQKGLDLLLRAFADGASADAALVLVGPDWRGHEAKLRSLCDRLGLGSRVMFAGAAFGRRKYELLAGADVFVHPSRWEAGVPFSVMEAAALGTPCLVTPASDPNAVFERYRAGLRVRPEAPELAGAIADLARAPAAGLAEMGGNAAALVRAEFAWPIIARTIIESYRTHAAVAHG